MKNSGFTSADFMDHLYVIPPQPMDREMTLLIDRKTKEEVRRRFGIYVDHDWECNTIANTTIETAIACLSKFVRDGGDPNFRINFFNMLEFRLSIRVVEEAEKEGNINIVFAPGSAITSKADMITSIDQIGQGREERMKEKVSASMFFDSILGDNPALQELFVKIDALARTELSSKYKIVMTNKINDRYHSDYAPTAIAYAFLDNLVDVMMVGAFEGLEREVPISSLNWNDVIEFRCAMKPKGMSISCAPGYCAKLIVKDDGLTEKDDFGDLNDDECGPMSTY